MSRSAASPRAPAPAPSPDWAEIARAYRAAERTVAEIAAKYGIAEQTIYRRAKREGWPKRAPRRAKSIAMAKSDPRRRVSLTRRLHTLVDRQIADIEQRRAEFAARGETPDPAGAERDARALASLTRTLEKLTELEHRAVQAARAQRHDEDNADDIRAELERRLARIAAAADEKGVS